jgi:type II secretory ATPase GspE/PulE/Tfp pilus assembly ATPase PilB-like protein
VLVAQLESVQSLSDRLAYEQKLIHVVDRIHAAKTLDTIFLQIKDEIVELLDADRLTLYVVDQDKRELYSRFLALDAVREIRIPISDRSIAGYAALTRKLVDVVDAYDAAELRRIAPALQFDASWDKRTGYRTRQVLAMPILHEMRVVGVIQLLNKQHGPRFTREDEASVSRIARSLGIAFHNQAQLAAQRRPAKFDYLLAQHLVTEEELNAAIAEARRRQVDPETLLVEQYRVPKGEMGTALSQFYKVPFVEYDDRIVPPPDLLKELKAEYLKSSYWLPLRREHDGTVTILIDNPQDVQKLDAISQLLPRERIRFVVGLRRDILLYLGAGGIDTTGPRGSIAEIIGTLKTEEAPENVEEAVAAADVVDENDSTIIRLANQIIIDAYQAHASDIHVEPYTAQRDTIIRFRVDGSCAEYQRIPGTYRRAIVARLKIMAQLDIAERRKPQDGKIKFRLPDREIELRVATIPTQGGNEDVVMRILAASEPIPIDKLGMTERNLREMKSAAEKPYGLILCVGPTGSGKTTTLHSVLGYINKPERKIWTAEDPVEITQYGLRQVQVNPKIGFTFAGAMRSFLRADPDVIMVGEMRDEETAATGIEASLTGHLVFSTLHTNSAVETVIRLLDMGLDPFNFSDALLIVLAQRLVKRVCPQCKEAYHPSEKEFMELAHAYGGAEALEAAGHKYTDDLRLYRGKGCPNCHQSGYRGRAGIHELLVASDEIKRLVQTKARVADLLVAARAEGMTTLVQDGIAKSFAGITDFRQVKAVAIK